MSHLFDSSITEHMPTGGKGRKGLPVTADMINWTLIASCCSGVPLLQCSSVCRRLEVYSKYVPVSTCLIRICKVHAGDVVCTFI